MKMLEYITQHCIMYAVFEICVIFIGSVVFVDIHAIFKL